MNIFIVLDFSEKGEDFIVAVFTCGGDEDDAIDHFCERSVATREDFEDGPLMMKMYQISIG